LIERSREMLQFKCILSLQKNPMVQFSTTIKQYEKHGDKTGWTYIDIPKEIAGQIKPGYKRTFRVKGKLDQYEFNGIALTPIGEGNFIMALNATIRKGIGKRKGQKLLVQIESDDTFVTVPPAEFEECLSDEPAALNFFQTLVKSHQRYFITWIDSAKTEPTKVKRISQAVSALSKGRGFGEMIRALKKDKDF
jgi:hypothetical protein